MANSQQTEFPYPATELATLERAGKRRVTRRFGRIMLLLLLVELGLETCILRLHRCQSSLVSISHHERRSIRHHITAHKTTSVWRCLLCDKIGNGVLSLFRIALFNALCVGQL